MARRFILVCYDITDDRRRLQVAKTLRDYGDRIQFSVFCCQVNRRELHRLKEQLKENASEERDSILFLDAGAVRGLKPVPNISCIGQPWQPGERSQIV